MAIIQFEIIVNSRYNYMERQGNKDMKKIMTMVLAVFLLVSLAACKSSTPTKAVEEYLKSFQKSGFQVTMWYKMDPEEKEIVEDLVTGVEFRILGEEDWDGNKNLQEKAVKVEITGYDIGAGYRTYFENNGTETLKLLNETYTYEQLYEILQTDKARYEEIYLQANREYFKSVMEEVKAAGKTYTNNNCKFIAYYNSSEKEWAMNTNDHLAEYIDYVTGNMNSVMLEFQQGN